MAQTTVSFRIDEELKKIFEETCDTLGLSMTTAFTVFVKKAVRERRIPFEISADRFYSESNIAAINDSDKQYKEGKVVCKTLDELREYEDE